MNRITKLFCAVMAIMFLLSAFPISSSAATEYKSGKYTYTVLGSNATIVSVDTSISGAVTIPNKIGKYTVTAIGEKAFYGCKELTEIKIPDSIKSLGEQAFASCEKLSKITLGAGVTSLPYRVFSDCYALKTFNTGSNLKNIDYCAFYRCYNLEKVNIGSNITSVSTYAFDKCYSLYEFTGGSSKYAVMDGALWRYIDLIKDGWNTTDYSLVRFATKDSTLHFTDQESWSSFEYSDVACLAGFGYGDFRFTTEYSDPNLTNTYRLKDNMLQKKLSGGINWYDIKYIGNDKTYTYSEYSVPRFLYDSAKFEKLTLGEGVNYIGERAFSNCRSLKTVSLPESLLAIEKGIFADCVVLDNVTIPSKVTVMSEGVFEACTGLKTITLPKSITEIQFEAFWGCNSLEKVYFEGTKSQWYLITKAEGNEALDNAAIICSDGIICNHAKYSTVVTNPTTTTQGFTTYTCVGCGHSYVADYVDILKIELKGTIEASTVNSDEIYIELIGADNSFSLTLSGDATEYSFTGLEEEVYTLKISQNNCVTREYEVNATAELPDLNVKLHLIGDINGDGKVNTVDVAKANACAKSIATLEGYELSCADINGDGKVNTLDVSRMNAHAKSVTTLW